MRKTKIIITSCALLLAASLSSLAQAQAWQWSNGLQMYYYTDNDGSIHYSDGSVSSPNTTWTNSSGVTVYSANSAGPKDTTGQYAIQQQRIDESSIGAAPNTPPCSN